VGLLRHHIYRYRPTAAHPEWKTRANLHLDVQPWGYVAGETHVEKLEYSELVDFITEVNSVVKATGTQCMSPATQLHFAHVWLSGPWIQRVRQGAPPCQSEEHHLVNLKNTILLT
jgi:hypothetical protein